MTCAHIIFLLNTTAALYPSPLQHEGQPDADHICVSIYIDVLHKY
jgi:hypothetical protein